jgi:hypothetical protein
MLLTACCLARCLNLIRQGLEWLVWMSSEVYPQNQYIRHRERSRTTVGRYCLQSVSMVSSNRLLSCAMVSGCRLLSRAIVSSNRLMSKAMICAYRLLSRAIVSSNRLVSTAMLSRNRLLLGPMVSSRYSPKLGAMLRMYKSTQSGVYCNNIWKLINPQCI